MSKSVSEQELRKRLSSKLSKKEIEDLIDKHIEAASIEGTPDMDIVERLVQKGQEEKRLRVSFSLESDHYEALAAYFGERERPATFLVKKAVEEFISVIT
jgi:hypothetical protein